VTPLPGGGSQTVSGGPARRFHPRHRLDRNLRFATSARSTRRRCSRRWQRYPYGCSEQTVSIAMPLLYVNRLASIEHPRRRSRSRRADQPGDRARAQPPERERLVQGCGAPTATTMMRGSTPRHRLPHARTRAQFRGVAASVRSGARPAAQRGRQLAGAKQGQRRGDRTMRSMFSPATGGP